MSRRHATTSLATRSNPVVSEMAATWTLADLPSQHGRIAVVTGANRGLGFQISESLAASGATVVMACRDAQRARDAADAITARHPQAQLDVTIPIDLDSLDSVRRAGAAIAARYPRIDLLIHNGAAILVPLATTLDGLERHIGINHYAPFLLTGLLLPSLQAAPAARVIGMASLAHKLTPGLNLDDPLFQRRAYKPMEAYGSSKLAALLFTNELNRRLQRAGSPVIAATAHPGYSNTNPDTGGFWLRLATRLFAQPAGDGALPALYAATAPGVRGGDYIGPGGYKELRGAPKPAQMRPEARDAALAARLWAESERITGCRYLD